MIWLVEEVAALQRQPYLWALLDQGPQQRNNLQGLAKPHLIC